MESSSSSSSSSVALGNDDDARDESGNDEQEQRPELVVARRSKASELRAVEASIRVAQKERERLVTAELEAGNAMQVLLQECGGCATMVLGWERLREAAHTRIRASCLDLDSALQRLETERCALHRDLARLTRIMKLVAREVEDVRDAEECPICREAQSTSLRIACQPCGHVMCLDCADRIFCHIVVRGSDNRWPRELVHVSETDEKRCPMCRGHPRYIARVFV
jgi:hypothetical protein